MHRMLLVDVNFQILASGILTDVFKISSAEKKIHTLSLNKWKFEEGRVNGN